MKGYSKFVVEIMENIDNSDTIKITTDREMEAQIQYLLSALCQQGSNISVRLVDHRIFNS